MQRNQVLPEEEKPEEDESLKIEQMPLWSPDWHQGRFRLNVNYCHDCTNHTCLHEEADFG